MTPMPEAASQTFLRMAATTAMIRVEALETWSDLEYG